MCKSLALAAAGRRVLFLCHRQAAAQMQVRWPEDAAGLEGAAMKRVAIKCGRAHFAAGSTRPHTGATAGIWTARTPSLASRPTCTWQTRRRTRSSSTTPPPLSSGSQPLLFAPF